MLNLTKPLVFLDLEATGLNLTADRIIDIAMLKAFPGGETQSKSWRVNPGIPIPAETTKIHGITDEDVKDSPSFAQVVNQVMDFIGNADLAGYNSNRFDIPMLIEECLRVDVDFDLKNRKLIDVQHIFYMMEPRSLSAAYKFYCNKKLENAHNAEADVRATYEVLLAQVERYKGVEIENKKGEVVVPIENNVTVLSSYTAGDIKVVDLVGRIVMNEKGVEVFNFGKHKDKSVEEVFRKEPAYYHWIMQGDFALYTKKIVTQIYLRCK
jgi:DNA polymerase-3 subunit epsilon